MFGRRHLDSLHHFLDDLDRHLDSRHHFLDHFDRLLDFDRLDDFLDDGFAGDYDRPDDLFDDADGPFDFDRLDDFLDDGFAGDFDRPDDFLLHDDGFGFGLAGGERRDRQKRDRERRASQAPFFESKLHAFASLRIAPRRARLSIWRIETGARENPPAEFTHI